MSPTSNDTTYAIHCDLNPLIWDCTTLKPEIREKLLENAMAFLDSIETDIDVEDITLTGSLANYTYTKYSDFDLHIITNFNDYGTDQVLLKDYFDAKKTIWNTNHDIKIKGYEVELYIQDSNIRHHSTGVYSLKTDTWLVKPKPIDSAIQVDKNEVLKKKKTMLDIINYALSPECSLDSAIKAKEKFLDMRKIGLEKSGEFSPENLAYKELRRSGDIERLILGVTAKKDRALSLKQENFNSYTNLYGAEKRGPRHQSLTAGVNKATSANAKTVGMVARMHTDQETPFPKIERLKAKVKGIETLTPQEVQGIAAFYDLDLEKIKQQPRGLSTSGIKIKYNPLANIFVLTKNQ